jgi:hypothetical protein
MTPNYTLGPMIVMYLRGLRYRDSRRQIAHDLMLAYTATGLTFIAIVLVLKIITLWGG